jgi:mercuric ion binding protein
MKLTYIITVFSLLTLSITAVGQSKVTKANIKVYGNCIMCKKRIETALDQNGIKQAQWNSKTKNMEIVYNPKKISERKIHELIAAVGHDTDSIKAKDEVYAKLPFCCLYRDHDHSGMHDSKPHDHK